MVRDPGARREVARRSFPEGVGRSEPLSRLQTGRRGIAGSLLLPVQGAVNGARVSSSTIRPVTLDEIVGLERYEVIRDEFRRRTIALKRNRRVSVGDDVTFVFENHDTVLFQIQEMLRAERITDL